MARRLGRESHLPHTPPLLPSRRFLRCCAALQLTEHLGEATGDENAEGPELQIGKPLGTSTGVFVPLASTLL